MKLINVLLVTVLSMFSSNYSASNSDALLLSPSHQDSNEGYFNLRWNNMMSNHNMKLQLSFNSDFSQIARSYPLSGTNKIALSGFKDGRYYFRLIDDSNRQISNTAMVNVKHSALNHALRLFLLGGILFVILLSALYFSGRFEQQSKFR